MSLSTNENYYFSEFFSCNNKKIILSLIPQGRFLLVSLPLLRDLIRYQRSLPFSILDYTLSLYFCFAKIRDIICLRFSSLPHPYTQKTQPPTDCVFKMAGWDWIAHFGFCFAKIRSVATLVITSGNIAKARCPLQKLAVATFVVEQVLVPSKETKNATLVDCVFKMAGWTGLEPAASCVTGRRSNQLNYHPN